MFRGFWSLAYLYLSYGLPLLFVDGGEGGQNKRVRKKWINTTPVTHSQECDHTIFLSRNRKAEGGGGRERRSENAPILPWRQFSLHRELRFADRVPQLTTVSGKWVFGKHATNGKHLNSSTPPRGRHSAGSARLGLGSARLGSTSTRH